MDHLVDAPYSWWSSPSRGGGRDSGWIVPEWMVSWLVGREVRAPLHIGRCSSICQQATLSITVINANKLTMCRKSIALIKTNPKPCTVLMIVWYSTVRMSIWFALSIETLSHQSGILCAQWWWWRGINRQTLMMPIVECNVHHWAIYRPNVSRSHTSSLNGTLYT